ncbi:unnamed protein product [Peniophora sp. CBMAI 1063]|nr:unnamed protein product [Peniophora sp. CBMAI 1063]
MSEEFIQVLRDHPTEVIREFRELYLDLLEDDNDDYMSSIKAFLQSIEDTELEGAFAAHLDGALRQHEPLEETIGTVPYWTLLHGLSRACPDVVCRMDFFTLPIATATYVLRILSVICEAYIREEDKFSEEATVFKMRTVEIWAHVWNIREALSVASQDPSFQVNVLPAMISLLHQSVDLHTQRFRRAPPLESKMSHIGLLLYVLLPEELEDSALILGSLRCLSHYATLVLDGHGLRMATQQGNALARFPWLQGIGFERILTRLRHTLENTQRHIKEAGTVTACLHLVWFLVCCRGTIDLMIQRDIFGLVNKARSTYSLYSPHDPEMRRVWCTAHEILRVIYTDRLTYGTPLNMDYTQYVSGADVVYHLSQGIVIAANHGELKLGAELGEKDYAPALYETISSHINFISGLSFWSTCPEHTNGSANMFIAYMKKGAREVWWHGLSLLRDKEARSEEGENGVLGGLIDIWWEFGMALGLDEDEERKLHESRDISDTVEE